MLIVQTKDTPPPRATFPKLMQSPEGVVVLFFSPSRGCCLIAPDGVGDGWEIGKQVNDLDATEFELMVDEVTLTNQLVG